MKRTKRHAHGYVLVSSYGKRHESQHMANGSYTTKKVVIRDRGKKRLAYIPIVACKSFPFGTVLEITYKGRKGWYVVEDRGPYVGNRFLDIGPRGQDDLKFSGVAKMHYRVIGKLKKGQKIWRFPGLVTKNTRYHKKGCKH